MAKFNLKSVLSGLVRVQQTLRVLEQAGVDVDRLIGISNAQGPQAKMIKAILQGAVLFDDLSDDDLEEIRQVAPVKPKKLPAKPRKSQTSKS